MNRVLEPGRRRNALNAFTVREDSLYGLRPEADIWVDVDELDDLISQGDSLFENDVEAAIPYYRQAMKLYKGEFLQELPYAEWCSEERERLLALILRTADRLARTLIAKKNWQEAIDVCHFILSHDDCWEQAYRLMMIAHAQLSNRAMALRIFRRCEERLQTELGVRPSASTIALHRAIQEESPHFLPDENDLA
jgi:DNA-binding SARP family transcriptional activator